MDYLHAVTQIYVLSIIGTTIALISSAFAISFFDKVNEIESQFSQFNAHKSEKLFIETGIVV